MCEKKSSSGTAARSSSSYTRTKMSIIKYFKINGACSISSHREKQQQRQQHFVRDVQKCRFSPRHHKTTQKILNMIRLAFASGAAMCTGTFLLSNRCYNSSSSSGSDLKDRKRTIEGKWTQVRKYRRRFEQFFEYRMKIVVIRRIDVTV